MLRLNQLQLIACLFVFVAASQAQQEPAADDDDEGVVVYYSANALYNRKLYTLAAGEYRTFLEKYPEHPKTGDARYGLALSFYALGKFAEAEPELRGVLQLGNIGDAHQLQLMLGQCLLKLGKPIEAEQAFKPVAALADAGPSGPVALAGLAEALFKQQKWRETVQVADRLIQADPGEAHRIRGLYQAGYARHRLKQYQAAIAPLERLVAMAAGAALHQQASFLLAECAREIGDLEKAAKHYAAATGLEGVEHEVFYRLGFVRFLQKQYDVAITALDRSLQLKPDSPFAGNARICLGRAWLEKKDYAKAIAQLKPLTAGTAGPAFEAADEAALWLARAHTLQNEHDQAAAILGAAIARFPKSRILRELRFDHANALIATGDFKEAAGRLAGMVDDAQWEQRNDAVRLYAVCLHRDGDYVKSLKYAVTFLAAAPADPYAGDIMFLKAENLYLLDKLDDAAAAYRVFLEKCEAHAQTDAAALRIAQVLHRKGRWAEALALAGPLAKKTAPGPFLANLQFLIGDCLFRLEKWTEAAVPLKAFLQGDTAQDPRADTALVELGIASVRHAAAAQAAGYFERIVTDYPDSPHLPVAAAELGRLRYEAGAHAAARKALELCVKREATGAQRPKAEYYLGWVCLAEKKEAAALGHFQAIVTAYPTHQLAADAALQLGLLQLAAERYPEARLALEGFLGKNPDHAEAAAALYALGIAKARAGDRAGAIVAFKQIVDRHPDSDYADRAVYEWAWCEKELKRPAEAIKRYEHLLTAYPNSALAPRVKTELAELTFDAKDYDKVISQLEQALPELQDRALREQALYRLGTALFNKGVFEKSAATFEGFIKEYPQSDLLVSATYQAGESRLKLLQTTAARDHFRAVTTMESAPAVMESALIRLGETQSMSKQWPEAATSYRAFLDRFPESRWGQRARYGYAFALEKQGRHEEALAEYGPLVAAKGKDELSARSQFQIGECLFALKKYDEAIKEFVWVTVKYGYEEWSVKALLEIGRVLEAKGDLEKAMDQFREVVQKYPDHDAATVAKQRLDALRRRL